MRSVGIKLLKNKLREYFRLAAGGETVLVTDRDRVVLVRRRLAEARWFRMGSAQTAVMKLQEILADLQQDRADRWSSSIARWRVIPAPPRQGAILAKRTQFPDLESLG